MAKENIPNADAEEFGLFDQLQSFEIGILPTSDHETTDVNGDNVTDDDDHQDTVEETEGTAAAEEVVTEQVDDDNPTTDTRIAALVELMRTEQMLGADDEIEPTIDNLSTIMERSALHLFEGYLNDMPPLARDLVSFISNQPKDFTAEQAQQFFERYFKPTESFQIPENDEQAMDFLHRTLTAQKVFPSDEDLQTYLDTLLEKGKLLDVAKPKAEEQKLAFEQQRAQLIEQSKVQQQQRLEGQKQFYKTIFDTVDSEPWHETRKAEVRKVIDPVKTAALNKAIQASPKAIGQLGLLYSFFNEETGEFDLTKFGEAAQGKAVEKTRETLKRQQHESALQKLKNKGASSSTEGAGFWDTVTPTH
jgi:hypothetical protein